VERLSGGDKPQRFQIFRYVEAALDQNTARIAVFKRVDAAAGAAQPEMLYGVSVWRILTGRMIFMETKEQALPVVKRGPAVRVCAN
jgi:hypothetical protein